MSFPDLDIPAVQSALSAAYLSLGHRAIIHLRDGPEIDIRVTTSALKPEDLTAGLQQSGLRVRLLAREWDDLSPVRPPQKGDTITVLGRRYGIQTVHLRAMADIPLVYVFEALG